MNSSNFRFTLDLHSTQAQYSIPAMVGDTGVTLLINITDGGVPYIITDGCLAKLSIKRPTGTHLEEFCKIRNNAIIEYPFSQNENTCAVAGIHNCDVTLYSPDGAKLGCPSFTMVVSEKVVRGDDIVLTDEDWTAVDSMIVAEANRAASEEARVASEAGRVEAEIARSAAEEERANAEAERVEAEENRIKATAEDANRAEVAANKAETAARSIEVFDERISHNEESITSHNRRLKVLESGVIAGFDTDDTAAYQKTVPANALGYARLEASGVVSKVVKSSNLWRGVTEFTLNAPYEVGVKKAIGTVSLPAGMYYVSGIGDFGGGMILSDDMGRLVLGESDSRWLTLESTQTVTVYAVVYEDFAVNGSEFESVSFAPIGVFSLSYEGEDPSYERPFDPYIKTTVLKSVESKDSAGANTVTYTVPDNIAELQKSLIYKAGGESGDYIDWINKRAVKHYKAVDLGDLEWTLRSTTTPYWIGSLSGVSKKNGSMVLSDVYNETEQPSPNAFPDRSWFAPTAGKIWIRDSRYTDAAAFKEAVRGTMLYYVSNTPEYTDIDAGDFDGFIKVYPSGRLTFVNDDNAAIPTTVTYQLKEE